MRARLPLFGLSLLGLVLALASTSTAIAAPAAQLDSVVGGFDTLVSIDHAGDGRLFLSEQGGLVHIWDGNQLLATPFLDLTSLVGGGFEGGIKSLAFHPDYAVNGFFFVHYSDSNDDNVVARYSVSSGDPNVADPTSARILLTIEQFTTQHKGGTIAFGADGFLYIALGDGGGQNDPECRAQRTDTLLGKLLRIDVDQNVSTAPFHGIPATNPFGGAGEPPAEVWSIGFRNLWRISFDRLTGDLFMADVGQNSREEVSFEEAGAAGGRNYGWRVMEGTFCHDPDPIDPDCPLTTPSCFDSAYTPPILEYDHSAGDCSITGGFVYRGTELPGFYGRYLYGDFCTGNLWAAENTGGGWVPELLDIQLPSIITFGQGADGEIYLTDGSVLHRLAPSEIFVDGFESGDLSGWSVSVP